MAKAELGFKKQLSKEERVEKKKQRLAAIGKSLTLDDLLGLSFGSFILQFLTTYVL